jgi:hypothetical protein
VDDAIFDQCFGELMIAFNGCFVMHIMPSSNMQVVHQHIEFDHNVFPFAFNIIGGKFLFLAWLAWLSAKYHR